MGSDLITENKKQIPVFFRGGSWGEAGCTFELRHYYKNPNLMTLHNHE